MCNGRTSESSLPFVRIVCLISAIILAACSRDAQPSNPPVKGPVLASIVVGARPATPVVGEGAVWIPNTGDGTISNDVGLAKRRLAIGEALMLDHHLAEAHIRAA